MLEGAIFDLDGTILDSMYIWDTIGEEYLRSLGYEPKENINEIFRSFSLYQAVCYYKSEYGVPMSEQELMDGVNKTVEDHYFYSVPAKAGLHSFLRELSEAGVRMCVATATDRYQVEAALKRLGLDGYFLDIFTCTEVGHGKDEPDIFRKALMRLGTDKSSTAVFEDALYAADTAKRDGFITIGVYDEHTKEQEELKALSDAYIQDYMHTENFWSLAESI